jgi:hypothetical protein
MKPGSRRQADWPPGYEAALKRYQREWAKIDEVLYDVCGPNRSSDPWTYARVFLVGRVYASGIERRLGRRRRRKSRGKRLSSRVLRRLCERLVARRRKLVSILRSVRGINEPLDRKKLRIVVEAHRSFLKVVGRRSAPSFASKFLHFHAPTVPIFDSVARGVVWSLYPGSRRRERSSYGNYANRFLQLYQTVRESRPAEENLVRRLDYYLLWLSENRGELRELKRALRSQRAC